MSGALDELVRVYAVCLGGAYDAGLAVSSLSASCLLSIKQLSEPSMSSALQQGDSWIGWIYRLTEILNKVELPTFTRKNLSDAEQSPFVLFVWELQKCLPEEKRAPTRVGTPIEEGSPSKP